MEFAEVVKCLHKVCGKHYPHCLECESFAAIIRHDCEVPAESKRMGNRFELCAMAWMLYPEVAEGIAEEWKERHTLLDIFHRLHPDGEKLPNGSTRICPYHIDRAYGGLCTDGSGDCKACWSREVEG